MVEGGDGVAMGGGGRGNHVPGTRRQLVLHANPTNFYGSDLRSFGERKEGRLEGGRKGGKEGGMK